MNDFEKKQMKHTVTYSEKYNEKEIFDWVESKSDTIGPAKAIKLMLKELMLKEKKENENKK